MVKQPKKKPAANKRMRFFRKSRAMMVLFLAAMVLPPAVPGFGAGEPDGKAIVEKMFNHMRGRASESTVKMTIHRPDWERSMTIHAWTRGLDDSLFVIDAPAKDKGNGTLKKGREMWMYNPKVNRVIKIPPSMMAQSWQGSDFSNNDLAKSDTLLNDYQHSVLSTQTVDGKKVYFIESIPNPQAPVVWGKLTLKIREDEVLLEETFFDEDKKPVKVLACSQVEMMGGRLFPKIWRMQKADVKDEYTLLVYDKLAFKDKLPDRLFTQSALSTFNR